MVIAISPGGKSASTLEAMRKVQAQGRPVFALTADPQSPLGKAGITGYSDRDQSPSALLPVDLARRY